VVTLIKIGMIRVILLLEMDYPLFFHLLTMQNMFVKIIIKNYLDVNIMDLHLENKILQYQTIQTKIITVILN